MSPTIPTQLVVVKTFKRDQLQSSPQLIFRMMRERYAFDVMSQLPHPFVISFRFALLDATFAYLGMEHAGGGDLFTLIGSAGPFPPAAARIYVGESNRPQSKKRRACLLGSA